ncbi:MAG TPA: methyltransferase domain-containing protein [Gammaproteobacteria bacterium]|nr:methyltransferase domain-containing protein [Gammaproteobacteria bacterium]
MSRAYNFALRLPRRALSVPRRGVSSLGQQLRMRRVPIDKLLIGGDSGQTGEKFARTVGDLMRPSRRIADSPHAQLLRAWQKRGEAIFDKAAFEQTAYYREAARNIDIFGNYFDARSNDEIVQGAKRYVECFRGADTRLLKRQRGQSAPGSHIVVRPIEYSDCFQIVDGHHRAAIAAVRGDTVVSVEVSPDPVLTPLQQLLFDVLWIKGRKELYQPVDAPELEQQWVLVRQCTDRLEKMTAFLAEHDIPAGSTYLDVGCSYGWFVDQMGKRGYQAAGVERDPFALQVGQVAYGLAASRTTRSDCVRFLREHQETWDVVSSFSLLHHFVLGNGGVKPEEFIRLLDLATRRVLFLDMGQSHESWYRDTLTEWTAPYIQEWLQQNTSFTTIEPLGPDADAVPPFEHAFGRMLFACYRR